MFRRKFRRFGRRRRRPLPETFTTFECRQCLNAAGNMTCLDPRVDVFPLIMMSTHKTVADTTELVSPERKSLIVDAIKFTAEHHTNPFDWQQCNGVSGNPNINSGLNFILTIWEAIILLPLAQGTTNVPDYIPLLTSPLLQAGDIADRVLWKRLMHLAMFGPTTGLLVPNMDSTLRYEGSGPQVVKSKCRVDDRHGLFYVRNMVHNVLFPNPVSFPGCNLDCDAFNDDVLIPVMFDSWFKIYYHGSQRG